ncbi:MAG: metal ABC transporter permease [Fibrobacter sp.]|jgi:zinc transport system permease protein|nr:metal ABC transporter permease [Fibrobacter sp.]
MNLCLELIAALPFEWAQYKFMQQALLAVLITGPLLAFLGCMVVNNQMAFFSDAVGHSAFTGIAIGTILGLDNPLWSMILFSIFFAVCITLLKRHGTASTDTVTGIMMSTSLSLGIVILSRGGSFNRYSQFLIGDFLSISPADICNLMIIAILFLIVWVVFFNKFFLVSLNTSLAGSRKIPVWWIQTVFAVVTALVVAVSIQWIGILVINALIILPAATSRNLVRSTFYYVWIASAVSIVSGIAGLITSFYWSTASGATIVLFTSTVYFLSVLLRIASRKVI